MRSTQGCDEEVADGAPLSGGRRKVRPSETAALGGSSLWMDEQENHARGRYYGGTYHDV